ncbi:ShlB/FhaC/HecB family hemolysin secretion/activation protein [Roseofilum casamattae]|uniref:ShlB/FhaC/HecB family hemolysin secretion/activation protein n=1 Tax=Roseofilum casamattae BLCC-M143 TaxID=3022442 RepID=A0ABT7C2C8_9CYAN|nr:ShlB/FhaC/HecB family hemolysin secretion/activation protein [Roseofilum casamattae]MDJ1185435.1 ShlB/FhaC/HecB family hemolysin secretion/activation protein [Roseofilum casamattae BLCC-M143]
MLDPFKIYKNIGFSVAAIVLLNVVEITSFTDRKSDPIMGGAIARAEPPDSLLPIESSGIQISQRVSPPIPQPPLPSEPLPPPEEILIPTEPPEELDITPPEGETIFFIESFEIEGNTVFSDLEITEALSAFIGRELTFVELLEIRSIITALYADEGYVSSGAIIPPQRITAGQLKIQIVEGRLEEIEIVGNRRLRSNYIRRRLALAGSAPLNINRLLEGVQLLRLDPLIENISGELQVGNSPETRRLVVTVTEADSFTISTNLDNARVPSVGTFRRQLLVEEGNLTGLGDRITGIYTNTDGSSIFDFNYILPLNASNGTLSAGFGIGRSRIITEPFDRLGITSASTYYRLSYRQPLILTPRQEFAFGLTFSWQDSQTELDIDDIGPFPLSPGSDDRGSTRIAAMRFFQEWTTRSERHVLALRSQLSVGLNELFNASSNPEPPDNNFYTWRGQGQWVHLLAPDTVSVVRGDIQLADRPLVPLEQIGLGGATTVRGYRQEALLTDNGALLSAEVQIPVVRVPAVSGILHLIPFVDFGVGWNERDLDLEENLLVGTGLGLSWQMSDRFTARIDWGIPLTDLSSDGDSWQENGIYFSIFTKF